jgi:hypothetical protein
MSHMSQSCGCDPHHGIVCWAHQRTIQSVEQPSPVGEGAQVTSEPEVIERTGEHPLSKAYADPKFRRDYAEGLRREAANLRRSADAIEADADKIAAPDSVPALPPERAALVLHLESMASAMLQLEYPEYAKLARKAAAALRGETGEGK